MADPITEQFALKALEKGPMPPGILAKGPKAPKEKPLDQKVSDLFSSWEPTTDEGKRYKQELGALTGGGPLEAMEGPPIGL
jgi:hypothetical protein